MHHYLKVALRVTHRNGVFSLINFSGLVLGMTGALLLALWIRFELSFEQFHEKKDDLYVAWSRWDTNGQIDCDQTTPRILAPTLAAEFSAVNKAVSYAAWGESQLFQVGQTSIQKSTGVYTDPAFLTMFTLPLRAGDPATALGSPNGLVITKDFAVDLFGDKPALGEPVTISQSGQKFEFVVTGVMESLPPNTEFKFDYLLSFLFLESLGSKDTFWGNNSVTTLVELKNDTDPHAFNEEIRDIEKKHYKDGQNIEIFLHPITDMRLHARFENGLPAGGRIETVRLLGILAAGLVVIAAINFINLSTARAQRRAKEVAVKKVTGATRRVLIQQFLTESMLMTIAAGAVSVTLSWWLLPLFNALVNQPVPIGLDEPGLWLMIGTFVVLTGILAGCYPALYLSSFMPVSILKGVKVNERKVTLRNALVVGQFGFAVLLIVSSVVVRQQLIFVQHRDAGYNMSSLMYLPLSGQLRKNFIPFRDELMTSGIALSITKASAPLTEQWSGTTDMEWSGRNPEEGTNIERIYIDQHISATAGLTIIQGRDMDLEKYPSDSTAVLINETALKLMNFTNPIGEVIKDGRNSWTVIGVVKDFVFTSPYQAVEPIALFGNKRKWASNVVYIKLNPAVPVAESVATLSALTTKYNPEYPSEYHFADADYGTKFNDLKATLRTNAVFTGITIFVACLGLFGLAIFMAESRKKEIGIRKVMGGSIMSITKLLGYSSLKPVLLAIVIFTPMSWFLMSRWLDSFAYRTPLEFWLFVGAAGVTLFIAILTTGLETVRAALSNPVESLRNE